MAAKDPDYSIVDYKAMGLTDSWFAQEKEEHDKFMELRDKAREQRRLNRIERNKERVEKNRLTQELDPNLTLSEFSLDTEGRVAGFPESMFNNSGSAEGSTGEPSRNLYQEFKEHRVETDFQDLVDASVRRANVATTSRRGPYIGEEQFDIGEELRASIKRRRRKKGAPCAEDDVEEEDRGANGDDVDFSRTLELQMARLPPRCSTPKRGHEMIDRWAGEDHGFVNGSYIVNQVHYAKQGYRYYAAVVLRGTVGIHNNFRKKCIERQWKECLYQALVALCVKSQLRYKYTWSANVDYILDMGHNLFTHMGTMNHLLAHKFSNTTIYNYSFDIEIKMEQYFDVPKVDCPPDYTEQELRVYEKTRRDIARGTLPFGEQRKPMYAEDHVYCHPDSVLFEEWLKTLRVELNQCLFRCSQFTLALWKEVTFWYMYIPYRCDEGGFFDDEGYACMIKFCSRDALFRHLTLLWLRAYAHIENDSPHAICNIALYSVTFRKCELTNMKLLTKGKILLKGVMRHAPSKKLQRDDYDKEERALFKDMSLDASDVEYLESPSWLKRYKVTWVRCPSKLKKIIKNVVTTGKLRWHAYFVEERNKLFSLWGTLHPSDAEFSIETRGKQTEACYVVAAGMLRINTPEYWDSKTLDAIVRCGDKYYGQSLAEAQTRWGDGWIQPGSEWDRFLCGGFQIAKTMFEAHVLRITKGMLYCDLETCSSLWHALESMFLEYPFGVLHCANSSLAVFHYLGSYYMLDCHSTGPPLFQFGDGVAYMLRCSSMVKFMHVLVLTINMREYTDFQLNAVNIRQIWDVGKEQPKPYMKPYEIKAPPKLYKLNQSNQSWKSSRSMNSSHFKSDRSRTHSSS